MFTDKYIKSLKGESTRKDIREGKPNSGFGIRVFPNGDKSWFYIYKVDGRLRRMTLGKYPSMSLSEARKAYSDARDIFNNGEDPAELLHEAARREKEADTVKQLAAEYLEKWAKPRKRSWKEDQRILEKDVLPAIGHMKAKEVTRRDIIRLLDKVVGRGAPIAANRTKALLSKMFRFAVGRDIVPFSPCMEITMPAPENRKDRVLSDEEIRQHWHGILNSDMTEQTKVALLFQLVTAQRKGEVAAMRWDEIDEAVWTIPAENAKNGESHRVPLSPQALALLSRVKNDTPWLFPAPNGQHLRGDSISRATRRHLMRLKNESGDNLTKDDPEWFTPHDLRRTAATNMTKLGYNRLTVSKVLNHSEGGVTAIYDRHSYDKEKRQALEAWGRKLDSILTGEISSKVVSLSA